MVTDLVVGVDVGGGGVHREARKRQRQRMPVRSWSLRTLELSLFLSLLLTEQ